MINCKMQKVKAFFYVFFRSLIPQTSYYEELSRTSFSFSLKYFIFLLFFLNAIFITLIAIRIHPVKINRLLDSLNAGLNDYPKNLVLTLKKGILISSFNRPYFLWLDYENKKNLLVVVDENAPVQKINQYKSSILLTSKYLAIKNMRDDNLSVIALNKFSDQTIDSAAVTSIQNNIQKAKSVFMFLFFSIFIFLLFALPILSFFLNLFYLLFASLLVLVLFRAFSKKYAGRVKFGKTLQLSLHAITLPLTLDYGLTLLSIKSRPSSLLFLFLTSVFVFAAVYEAYYKELVDKPHVVPHRLPRRPRRK